MRDIPATYVAFDLLYLDGRSTMALTYEQRREVLEALALEGPAWRVPAYHPGDGSSLLAATKELGIARTNLEHPGVRQLADLDNQFVVVLQAGKDGGFDLRSIAKSTL